MSYTINIENLHGNPIEMVTADNWSELVYKAVVVIKNAKSANLSRQFKLPLHTYTTISFKLDKDIIREVLQQINITLEQKFKSLEEILVRSLSKKNELGWDALKDFAPFSTPEPRPLAVREIPQEPKPTDDTFRVPRKFLDVLLPSHKRREQELRHQQFEKAHELWKKQKMDIEDENLILKKGFEAAHLSWLQSRSTFIEKQNQVNSYVDRYRAVFDISHPQSVAFWFSRVLERLDYSPLHTRNNEVDYEPIAKMIVVDLELPSPTDLPTIKAVKVNQTQETINEIPLSEREREKLYDSVIYQIVLMCIYKLFQHDANEFVNTIVMNGWVNSISKATGKETRPCILSLQTTRPEFLQLDLSKVDPRSCFHTLRGIGSTKLHGLTPVAAIVSINREDKRFVQSHEVAEGLSEASNLAAMDWEEFEQLIRELFEKEFKPAGGEVKITQASRDGGVDAVAFDTDPIRGGKIVIQAKRYTNVVGVSAVRDLFGTLMNEGAMKGILVTTSHYGADAYEFARGKPITLLNGNNLLHLLLKHGYKAKIDLVEAKRLEKEQSKT
ncbi:MAG TPA: restriction endonuclease [Bacteroidota bacterium]|nr:restriction endonuclease [Bacteroidota bacterium]